MASSALSSIAAMAAENQPTSRWLAAAAGDCYTATFTMDECDGLSNYVERVMAKALPVRSGRSATHASRLWPVTSHSRRCPLSSRDMTARLTVRAFSSVPVTRRLGRPVRRGAAAQRRRPHGAA